MTEKAKVQKFNRIIFGWYKKHGRKMPWRETRDPYKILVSEIMLQQTGVERVRGKYMQFIKKYPTVQKLARAQLGDVLRLWSGLGYNRRAKYLHSCAQKIVASGGKFPETYEGLTALPGIGMSTAGALLAFSFKKETPMIDTNIRRILVRVFFKKQIPTDKALYQFAGSIIPKGKGREWNYALLDIGATLCTARTHRDNCPLAPLHGDVKDFSYRKPQKKFAGSQRYYRGKSLLYLTERKAGVTRSALHAHLLTHGASHDEALLAVQNLEREHLVVHKNAQIHLP